MKLWAPERVTEEDSPGGATGELAIAIVVIALTLLMGFVLIA